MSIVRLPRRARFAVISSGCIEDKRLSWDARGMLIYLLSKQDDWIVQIKDLINQTKECLGVRAGRDKVYKLLKELRCAGYLWRDFSRCGGTFAGVEYVVSEEPDLEAGAAFMRELAEKAAAKGQGGPFPSLPEAVEPAPAEPFTEKPETIDKTEKASSTEKAPTSAEEAGAASDGAQGFAEPEAKAEEPPAPANKAFPDTYPKNVTAKSYAPWMAYAKAYRGRYRSWPVCNKVVLNKICQLVDRVGDLAPRVAQYFVVNDTSPQATASNHSVGLMLQNCEGLATRAEAADRAAQARANARNEAEKIAAAASNAAADEPAPAKTKEDPSEVAKTAMALLLNRNGRGMARVGGSA
ncbi:hypothetical protein [Pseudomonas sp. PNPG3]|uniref:hypothetical protein n=1 Tax=Pseudomonas sp. PNPG3 TaxID=2919497 RepID=UPI001FFCF840|nr:hypothetical protein [Pseudomonas sp. PNPG3]MCK2122148.1 hypothetical protein [Pseudomonas sp. PNPG3]